MANSLLSQILNADNLRYQVDLSGLVPAEEAAHLPPLPPNHFYFYPPDPEVEGDGATTFVESSDPFDQYLYRLRRVVFQGRTRWQNVLIADTYNYDRVLMLDGAIQSAESDESLYHELLVQPAMLAHDKPRDVLIIGGGEGATLREVLAHASVRRAVMVDLDQELVELCREYLHQWHQGAFDDPRCEFVAEDGRAFLEQDSSLYDVVIIDVVDMLDNGPAQALYTRQFYELLTTRLRPGGIVAIQGLEFSHSDDKPHAALARTLRCVFDQVHSYRCPIPSFLSSWGFLLASNWFDPSAWSAEDIDRRADFKLGPLWLDHLDGAFLKACFVMDRETRFLLAQPGPVLEDGVTFVAPPDIEEIEFGPAQFPALPGH
ncbi:spermidine synthase [Pseudomonas nitritireducens]|uniref:Polyamine aminopropyltransferase n=1 Tax=Pseudomonas nitroreducens TaxID=46680 RepID=A0A7W7KN35_PSENT|nr:fused MFS/spermidine synthase [Pseudomonas nitritireducens]MBB4865113.1 spermidine synthase [Pseudomonas nitritireducens]